MLNKEFLKNFNLTGDVKKDNEALRNYFKVESCEPICFIKKENNEKVIISRDNYWKAFFTNNWDRLHLSERLRVIAWLQKDFLQKNNYANTAKIEFLKDGNIESKSYGAFTTKESIIFNLANLQVWSGFRAFETTIHECLHLIDFDRYDKLLNKYSSYNKYSLQDKVLFYDNLMLLPIEGKIYNYDKCTFEPVTQEMVEEILHLKSVLCSSFGATEVELKNSNKNFRSYYLNFVKDYLYYMIPYEYNAFNKSIYGLYGFARLLTNKEEILQKDIDALKVAREHLVLMQDKKRAISNLFGISYEQFINMEMIYKYNSFVYGNNKDSLAMDLMIERDLLIEKYTPHKKLYNYNPYK